jgi:uncharacterized protein (UPF0335 family)
MDWADQKLLMAHDLLESTKTQLESFSAEFERLARTPEQKGLAEQFKDFVGEVTGAGMREAFEKILQPKPRADPAVDYAKVIFGSGKTEPQLREQQPQQVIKSHGIER